MTDLEEAKKTISLLEREIYYLRQKVTKLEKRISDDGWRLDNYAQDYQDRHAFDWK